MVCRIYWIHRASDSTVRTLPTAYITWIWTNNNKVWYTSKYFNVSIIPLSKWHFPLTSKFNMSAVYIEKYLQMHRYNGEIGSSRHSILCDVKSVGKVCRCLRGKPGQESKMSKIQVSKYQTRPYIQSLANTFVFVFLPSVVRPGD